MFGLESGSEEEFVVILAFSLAADGTVGGGVHEFDGDGFTGGRESAGVDRTKAAVTEDSGEGVCCAAEEGVGERVRRVGVRVGGGSGSFFVAKTVEKCEDERATGDDGGGVVVVWLRRWW